MLDSSEISIIQLPTKSWLILLQIKYFMTNIGILLRSFLSNISTSAPASQLSLTLQRLLQLHITGGCSGGGRGGGGWQLRPRRGSGHRGGGEPGGGRLCTFTLRRGGSRLLLHNLLLVPVLVGHLYEAVLLPLPDHLGGALLVLPHVARTELILGGLDPDMSAMFDDGEYNNRRWYNLNTGIFVYDKFWRQKMMTDSF